MWPWRVKMPTQNLLRLFLLQMLMLRIMLATVCCRFVDWGLIIKLNFEILSWSQATFWSWSWLLFCRWYFVEFCWILDESWVLVNILKFEFREDLVFSRWCFVEVMTLNRGRDSKFYLVDILKFMFSRDADVWLRFWNWFFVEYSRWNLIKIWVRTCDVT